MPIVGRGEDHRDRALVVERDVAAGDRRAEHAAGVAHPADRFLELVEDLGALGVPEVEAVGDRHGARAGAGDVARGLGDGDLSAGARFEVDVAPVAIGLEGDRLVGSREPHDGGVAGPGPITVLVRTVESYWR